MLVLKKENHNKKNKNIKFVNLIGLDKITAKTIPIKIKLGETAKFGLLRNKSFKMWYFKKFRNQNNSVAYLASKRYFRKSK